MGVYIGSTPVNKFNVGSSEAKAVYVGSTQVWSAAPPPVDTLKQGLISLWEFDEKTGSVVDAHGGNTLTNNGATTYQTGIVEGSKAYSYNGSSSQLSYPSSNVFNPAGAQSVSTWFKRDQADGTKTSHVMVARMYSSTGLRIFDIALVANNHATVKNRLQYRYYDSSNVATGAEYNSNGSDLWTGIWHHAVGTRNGSSLKLYLDGALISSITGGNGSGQQSTNSALLTHIGAYAKSSTIPDSFFPGIMDQAAIWNRELTQEEVTALYNGGTGLLYSNFL